MAKTLSSASITDGLTVEAWHVTQSVDAFNSVEAYDITFSGSFTLSDDTVLAGTASYAITSSHAITASYAENAGGATVDTGSLLTTASISGDTITFTKGDATTFNIEVNNIVSASYASTASYVTTAQTASYVTTAQTASYVTTAQTASYVASTPAVNAGKSPLSAIAVSLSDLNLFVGSVQLVSGVATSSVYGSLGGKNNGQDAFITFGANHGSSSPGETYTGRIDPTGYILITDSGAGVSNAVVNFTCWFIP